MLDDYREGLRDGIGGAETNRGAGHDFADRKREDGLGDGLLEGVDLVAGEILLGGMLEEVVESGAGAGDGPEDFRLEGDEGGLLGGESCEAPLAIVEQGALTEVFARADGHDGAVAVVEFDAACFDDVKGEGGLAGVEDGVAFLEMNLLEDLGGAGAEEGDIAREEEIERPIDDDADLAVEAREFHQVNGAPHEPCDEAGEAMAHDIGDSGLVTNGGEFAEAGKGEGARRRAGAFEDIGKIFAEADALAVGELGGGRAVFLWCKRGAGHRG